MIVDYVWEDRFVISYYWMIWELWFNVDKFEEFYKVFYMNLIEVCNLFVLLKFCN